MSINRFVGPGFFLSLDLLLISLINWIYWILISSLTSASEIGKATSVYSFVLLMSAISMLGFEYSLLKKSSSQRSHILGASIIIELLITAISIPFVVYYVNNLYGGSLGSLGLLAVGILFFYSQRNIIRFTLLGNKDAISVLKINLIGAISQLVTGYVLVYAGFGAAGILISFFLHFILVTSFSFMKARTSFELNLRDFRYAREILKDALMNAPNSLSKTVIYTLSVVLLASIGIDQADVGTYYIALIISIIAGSFAGSIAIMVIPASISSKEDLSAESTRIGFCITSPLIVALMVAPAPILSIIGTEYASASSVLLILAISIFPYVIVINAISRFNNLGNTRRIIGIGTIQLITFLLSFFVLTPHYNSEGAALSILIASITSAIPSIIWSEPVLLKYAVKSCISIVAGVVTGYSILFMSVSVSPAIVISSSFAITLLLVLIMKITSPSEISLILNGLFKGNHR